MADELFGVKDTVDVIREATIPGPGGHIPVRIYAREPEIPGRHCFTFMAAAGCSAVLTLMMASVEHSHDERVSRWFQ